MEPFHFFNWDFYTGKLSSYQYQMSFESISKKIYTRRFILVSPLAFRILIPIFFIKNSTWHTNLWRLSIFLSYENSQMPDKECEFVTLTQHVDKKCLITVRHFNVTWCKSWQCGPCTPVITCIYLNSSTIDTKIDSVFLSRFKRK